MSSGERKKIFIPTIGALGDVKPFLILAKELQRRGHQVWLGAHARFLSQINAEGKSLPDESSPHGDRSPIGFRDRNSGNRWRHRTGSEHNAGRHCLSTKSQYFSSEFDETFPFVAVGIVVQRICSRCSRRRSDCFIELNHFHWIELFGSISSYESNGDLYVPECSYGRISSATAEQWKSNSLPLDQPRQMETVQLCSELVRCRFQSIPSEDRFSADSIRLRSIDANAFLETDGHGNDLFDPCPPTTIGLGAEQFHGWTDSAPG